MNFCARIERLNDSSCFFRIADIHPKTVHIVKQFGSIFEDVRYVCDIRFIFRN